MTQSRPSDCVKQCERDGFVRDFGDVIGWLLVIIGWWVVRHDERRRALRSEDRATVEDISKQISTLLAQAIRYHTSAPVGSAEAIELAATIKHELGSISRNIGSLRIRRPSEYKTVPAEVRLRQAMSGGLFETRSRQLVSHDHSIVQETRFAAAELTDALREAFEKAHRL